MIGGISSGVQAALTGPSPAVLFAAGSCPNMTLNGTHRPWSSPRAVVCAAMRGEAPFKTSTMREGSVAGKAERKVSR